MRFMAVITNQFPLPPEMVPKLVEGFASWWDTYRDTWVSAGFFAGGSGGGGICDVADATEFHKMMNEWPFTPYSHINVYALVDVDTALSQWRDLLASGTSGLNPS